MLLRSSRRRQNNYLVSRKRAVPDEEEDGIDIRLGDVVISKPTATFGGGVQYDLGKGSTGCGFERTGTLNKPPQLLRASVETLAADHRIRGSRVTQYLHDMLQKFPAMKEEYFHPGPEQDHLFQADYAHPGGANCCNCDKQRTADQDARRNTNPRFHYGTIGSANTVVKDARVRDELRQALKIICVEMEAAGLMDSFPCLVIRGICDYADSHKNKFLIKPVPPIVSSPVCVLLLYNYALNSFEVLRANHVRTTPQPRKRSTISLCRCSWPSIPYQPVHRCEGTCARRV
jgi:hypothetical protein